MIIGGAVISNGPSKCEFLVENSVPILRQNNIISPDQANTPARRIYLAIQLMYVDPAGIENHQKLYWQLVKDIVQAVPRTLAIIDQMNELILQGNYYQALKSARNLIEFEQEVIESVTNCS